MFNLKLHSKIWANPAKKARLYTRCSDTPLDVFIDVLANRNMIRLVKEGKATDDEIEQAWQKLYYEYCDISGSIEYRSLFNLIKEAGYLEGKLMSIRLALECINHSQTHDCINILKNYGYKYAFDKSKPDEFNYDVQKVLSKSKTLELLIKTTRIQIDRIQGEIKNEPIQESWFDDYLTMLSKYMGYRINRKVITVMEFTRMKKMLELEVESAKKHLK